MFWKKGIETEKRLRQMNEILKKSFANVKKDTSNIFQWINYLYKKNMEQEQLIKQLQMELTYMPKTREEIRQIIDGYYSFESIHSKIMELNYKIDEISKTKNPQPYQFVSETNLSGIERRLEKLEEKKASIKEKIVKKITRNSKEYVKSVMLSYIKKYEKISALQLKELVVDEQNFCSKSSFYRLLEEIEQRDDIGVIKQGKEKHYLVKAMKHV